MTLTLWGTEISYDEQVVSLLDFSMFLEQRAKKSAEDFLRIGIKKKLGWLNEGTDYLEAEMRRVCDDIGAYITQHNILAVPNWNMYLEPWITLANTSKTLTMNLHYTLINECNNEVAERANQAYRQSLANSEGLGFGIISNSLTAHLIYAVQSAQKEAENERAAQAAADAVRRNSDAIGKAGELTTKAYHETHEPFVLETLTSFYDNVESFIYTGAGYSKKAINEQMGAAAEAAKSTAGDVRSNIIIALRKDICCGEVILAAITENLIDDDFVDFSSKAPIILLKKSVNPVVGWLSREKRTNQLYNRSVFSEKIQKFLVAAQKLFLCGDSIKHNLYETILGEVFADEINGTYSACYDLLKGKAIVEKYANSGTKISLSSTTIGMLVTLCNQIRSNSIVNLLQSAGLTPPLEASQIIALQEETNIAISSRTHEIMRAKAEAAEKAAAEKAEKERIAAEARAKKQEADEKKRKQNAKRIKIAAAIILPVVAIYLVCTLWLIPYVIQPAQEYKEAEALLAAGQYDDAIAAFEALGEFMNASNMVQEAQYQKACSLADGGKYTEALHIFAALGDYSDSSERASAINEANNENAYMAAEALLLDSRYEDAITAFEALGDYKDSKAKIEEAEECINVRDYSKAEQLLASGKYDSAIEMFESLGTYKDSNERIKEAKYLKAEYLLTAGQHDDAISIFKSLGTYKDSANRIEEATQAKYLAAYTSAEKLLTNGKTAEAALAFAKLGNYSDAAERSWDLWKSAAQRSTLAAGQFSTLGITTNGSVVVVGGSTEYDFSQWTNIVSVCGGDSHYVGLKADGTVVATGYDADGQCNVLDWTNIVSISAGSSHTVGLRTDGTVIAVGNNELGQCDVSDWVDIIAIATGDFHTVGIKADGTVVAAGNNGDGQCEVSDWTNIVSVSAGIFHTVGLKSDGTVVAVGDNSEDQCQVSQWTDIVAIVAGRQHTVGLKSDGTLAVAGNRWADECQVSSWENIVAIGAGNWHTVGLTKNGTVVATGSNKYGQCDVSDWKNIRIPD